MGNQVAVVAVALGNGGVEQKAIQNLSTLGIRAFKLAKRTRKEKVMNLMRVHVNAVAQSGTNGPCAGITAVTATVISTIGCPVCAVSKNGKANCCFSGGSWRGKCGEEGNPKFEHTWDEGVEVCKHKNTQNGEIVIQ